MRFFHIALKIFVLLLVLCFVSWSLWGNNQLIAININHRSGAQNSAPAVPEASETIPSEDPPQIEQPLVGTCTDVVVSGAVKVWIYDSPRSKVVIWNSAGVAPLPSPRMVDGTLLIQGGAMDLAEDKMPWVSVFCRGVGQVIHRGKGDLTAHHLTGSHLSAITTGEASIYIGGEGDDCHLTTSGSGDIDTSWLRVSRLSITMSGSGYVDSNGEWTNLEVSMDGTGDLTVDSIRPAEVSVRLTGGSTAEVGQVQALHATIQGDGKIIANGSPTILHKEILGKGTVEVRP